MQIKLRMLRGIEHGGLQKELSFPPSSSLTPPPPRLPPVAHHRAAFPRAPGANATTSTRPTALQLLAPLAPGSAVPVRQNPAMGAILLGIASSLWFVVLLFCFYFIRKVTARCCVGIRRVVI